MAGSATITGRQNYVLGIGHPKTEAPTEGAPAVFSADGKSLVGEDGEKYSVTVTPKTDDYSGIVDAAFAVQAMGGGVVKLRPITYEIGENVIPLISGVMYEGAGYQWSWNGNVATAGTIIESTSTTLPVFATQDNSGNWTYTDLANPLGTEAALRAAEVNNAGVQDLAIVGGGYAIKAGAFYQPGVIFGQFKNILALRQSLWGFWFENCQQGDYSTMLAQSCGKGGFKFAGSGSIWNYGNYNVYNIFSQSEQGRIKSKNIEFESRGIQGSLNDVNVFAAQSNGANTTSTQAATMSNASPLIGVADISKFEIDMPVSFKSSSNGFYQNQIYFVIAKSADTGAGNLTLSDTLGGTARNATGSTAINIYTAGFPGIAIYASDLYPTAYAQCISVQGIDIEVGGTTTILCQNIKSAGASIQTLIVPAAQTAEACQTLTSRNSRLIFSSTGVETSVDIDSTSKVLYSGRRGNSKNAGTTTGIGVGLWLSEDNISTGISQCGVIALRGTYSPDIYINKGTGNVKINSGLDVAQLQFSTGITFGSTGNAGSFVFTGGSGVTASLPAANATGATSNIGMVVEVSNPTANTLTIAVSGGSQNIIGKGASGNSITVAALTNVRLIACNNNGTLYWSLM